MALAAAMLSASPLQASTVKVNDFLNSLGANAKFDQGADPVRTAPMVRYLGLRTLRAGGTTASLIWLHNATGVLFDTGLSSGPTDATIPWILENARRLANAGALLSLEGANEPNNFGATYHGKHCCIHSGDWMPVAQMQRDFYKAVKADPILKPYPVFDVSEVGAETSNVGMQYLEIPSNAGTEMPTGTIYADYANNHNYVASHCSEYHDNQAFDASVSYGVPCYDNISNEYGVAWARGFKGYSQSDLAILPKVTTETGWWTDGTAAGDDRQGKIFMNLYLDQYNLGWRYTYIYEIMDFTDGKDGFYANYTTPRLSATYLHNLTTILADHSSSFKPGDLSYSIIGEAPTVHHMLMQKSNGRFELAVWAEHAKGSSNIVINFGSPHASVKVYDPTIGTTPVKTYVNVRSIALTMTDHVLLIET